LPNLAQRAKGKLEISTTYLSKEDSELLREALRSYSGDCCLEIGFGYGSNLLSLKSRFAMIIGTDVQRTEGFSRLKESGIDTILADGATCFRSRSFDLVLINPPYLPSEESVDRTIDGGHGGFEVAKQLLGQGLSVLRRGGKILVVLSSETSKSDFELFCKDQSLTTSLVSTKRLFFEILSVYELERTDGTFL
jgi:release factor glutamine methyltransferase